MDRPTAVVTVASGGIGAAFASALAKRGHDLVIVSRTESRLDESAAALHAEHGIDVEVLAADLETGAGVDRVAERLRDPARPIEVLVNNAGFGTFGSFHELAVDQEEAMIALNLVALVKLSHAALGPMVERGRGGIINMSSVGAYQPTPYYASYSATKAFVSSFTNAIREELKGTGVKAMVVAPGFTRTDFHTRAEVDANENLPGFLWQSADEVAEAAMKAYERGRAVCVPGGMNKMAAAFSSTMPAAVSRKVAGAVSKRTD
jgi:short-subunit dehydrogenase